MRHLTNARQWTNIRVLAAILVVAGLMPGRAEAQGTSFLNRIYLGSGACLLRTGTGSPETVVTGNPCDVFLRTDGSTGTTLYVKETGASNTGWVAVGAAQVQALNMIARTTAVQTQAGVLQAGAAGAVRQTAIASGAAPPDEVPESQSGSGKKPSAPRQASRAA